MRTILRRVAVLSAVIGITAGRAIGADHLTDALPSSPLVMQQQLPASGYVAVIINNRISILSREAAAHALGKDLGHEDIAPLLEFLAVRPDPKNRNIAGLRYLKNEVMTALRNQNTAPVDFVQTLIAIYRDRLQDEVTRDYAIQHLGALCDIRRLNEEDLKNIVAALTEALGEHSDIAGTALIALHLLSRSNALFDAKAIDSTAVSLATGTGTPNSVRATAIQICAERGLKETVPALERFVLSEPELVQVAAISALGELGGEKDVSVLNRIAAAQDRTILLAVRRAVTRIRSRIPNEQF